MPFIKTSNVVFLPVVKSTGKVFIVIVAEAFESKVLLPTGYAAVRSSPIVF